MNMFIHNAVRLNEMVYHHRHVRCLITLMPGIYNTYNHVFSSFRCYILSSIERFKIHASHKTYMLENSDK